MKTSQRFKFYKYYAVAGDIFDCINKVNKDIIVVIPHVCGTSGKFNSGFAGALSQKHPETKINYEMLSSYKLGEIQIINIDKNKIVVNMICDNESLNKNTRTLNYYCLGKCMANIRNYIKLNYKDSEIKKCQIHAPRFGTGRPGGDWNFISELINDVWFDIETFIYTQKRERD